MSSNDRNQKRTDATEDDDFGDFEGPEDDAPECVQAMGGPPNWVFPDLLRVQSNRSANESPESLLNNTSSVPSSQRPNVLTRVNDIRGATGRETGAIPKQRALDPPDVSLSTTSQPKLPTTLDLCSSALRTNSYGRDVSAIPSVVPASQSVTSPLNRPSNLMSDLNSTSHNGSADPSQARIIQLERDLKSIQTQKALLQQQLLQKDTQIRELHSQSRQSVPNLIPTQSQDSAIASLTETVDRFRTTIESAMNKLELRLTSLESRVVNTSVSSVDCCDHPVLSNSPNSDSQTVSQTLCPNINSLLAEQRKEFETERRQNLLLFSSVLKKAFESIESHLDLKRLDSNHD